MQQTLSIIKPDAVSRNLIGKIINMLEESNLQIVAAKMMHLSTDEAAQFYAVHKEKSFFDGIIETMTAGPVMIQVLSGENAVEKYRKLMGATNPAVADEGTIRKAYGLSIDKNSVHGSDSLENAKNEISFFFSQTEIVR